MENSNEPKTSVESTANPLPPIDLPHLESGDDNKPSMAFEKFIKYRFEKVV